MKFEDFGLSEPILRAVKAGGYEVTTPIQAKAIPYVLEGRDLIGCAQTGTGKTAAFALPILHKLRATSKNGSALNGARGGRGQRRIRALMLSPTRELTSQIAESISTYGRFTGMRHAVVYGGVSQRPQVQRLRQGVDILVATPGRLLDLMNQGHVDLKSVEILTFDEADQMLDMGFIHDLRRIVRHVPRERQTLMFSATMPDAIRQVTTQWLQDPVHLQAGPAARPVEKVDQSVFFVEKRHKLGLLASFLKETLRPRTLVFSRTKHGADNIVRQLGRSGIQAAAIHGNKSQSARQRVLGQFKSDALPVLVATDVAARGLDIEGVSHVVNYDMPNVPEIYVHRIGRTGRAGAAGVAVSFCGMEERSQLRTIEHLIGRSITVETQLPDGAECPPPAAQGDQDRSRARRSAEEQSRANGYGRSNSRRMPKQQKKDKSRANKGGNAKRKRFRSAR
ncbi:MAG: DEAD/DEAH box helicase [Planctomycetota bacterium]